MRFAGLLLSGVLAVPVLGACSDRQVAQDRLDAHGDSALLQDSQGLDVAPPLACNGAVELCDRRFDQVAYACTHNAMSNADEGWQIPNQHHGLLKQLDDGVRAFMLDVHLYDGDDPARKGEISLCHGTCDLGSKPFAQAMHEMNTWLDAHPHEVVTLILEDYVTVAQMDAALAESGLKPRCLHQEKGKPFPTLRQMVEQDRRVFVMLESGAGPADWAHGYQDFAWDTNYANETPQSLDCKRLRGSAGNPLFVINHFLTHNLQAHEALAEQVNHAPVLHDHLAHCQSEAAQLPNVVAVDMYDIGDVLAEVRWLNGLPP